MNHGTCDHKVRVSSLNRAMFLADAGSAKGFTLVELLVGSVLVLIAAAGAALVVSSSSRMLGSSRTVDRLEAQVDDNVAAVRELATRFSCCSGTCGLGVSDCFTATAGDDRFYYPVATDGSTPGFLEFTTGTPNVLGLCENGGVGEEFRAVILANAPPAPAGVARDVVRANPADGRNHVVRLIYTGAANTGVSRVVDIIPPAAAWCP